MKASRRLTFQLTPLLDLLLIVIFAQYLEVRQTQVQADEELADRTQVLEREFSERVEQLKNQTDQEAAAQFAALEEQRERYAQQFDSIVDQHQRAGTTLAEAFDLPGEVIEQILSLQSSGQADQAERARQAAANLKQLLETRGDRFLQFLIRVDEMQKHVTVWEIYIQENGRALLTDGDQQITVSFETSDEFVTRLFEAGKSLPEPRTLVVMLLSHGDAQARFRRTALDSMPLLTEKFRSDSGNTHWYDFSPHGFQPEGPLFFRGPTIQPGNF
ncbi:MAG: hypothetical protein KDA85_22050 [Planctomycetaceae bacterium]|nr:hypothetical protein [Planctomycetaceae bacterium]